ncbi:unnamed protein product [Phytomonas sp. EM1]|nr:unnamed protein product [Phytomonas sp. EM1]|eukprot:CCW63809.1 unnamed protein product [Phytomonas sp. isolate EM1]
MKSFRLSLLRFFRYHNRNNHGNPLFTICCAFHHVGNTSQKYSSRKGPLIPSSYYRISKDTDYIDSKCENASIQDSTCVHRTDNDVKQVDKAMNELYGNSADPNSCVPLDGPKRISPPFSDTPLRLMQDWMNKRDFSKVVNYFEANYRSDKESFLNFCVNPCEARDVVLSLMRSYMSLGQMRGVRNIFVIALRDLAPQKGLTSSPTTEWSQRQQAAHQSSPASKGLSSSLTRHLVSTDRVSQVMHWSRPSLLNVNIFNAYLEVLTRRKNFDRAEVIFILKEMKEVGVLPNPLTYHYLIELHVRAGLDPKGLWDELIYEKKLDPLPCTVQVMLLRVVPSSPDSVFVVEVTRQALRHGSVIMDKRMLLERIEDWLQDPVHRSAAHSSTPKIVEKKESTVSPSGTTVVPACYPPEYILWLMLELEIRCVLDKAYFTQYVQQQHVAQLLLRCAKCADAVTTAQVLALMDRHMMARTADLLALVVWCWAQALELGKAFDIVELMARKGYLDFTDLFKRYHVECLRYTMDRHFLMVLADSISSMSLLDEVLAHLKERKRCGELVSVYSLDVIVLAACKLGEERRAMELVFSYDSIWGVRPQTSTLNCLLVGSSTQRGSVLLRTLYESMLKAGVTPNPQTFRVLIRQAVLHDDIDEAVYYLQEVDRHPSLRVEVEMILPIFERAARAGDVETVNKISKYSLDCDIGIDTMVLQTAMKNLTEAGQSIEGLKGHQPLHEALRSRSKVGRQRVRSEITL